MDWKPLEVRDEYGNGFEFIQKDDLVFPTFFKEVDERLKLMKELPHNRDDNIILICNYPKTGTHWVFNLVHHLTSNGPVDNLVTVEPKMMEPPFDTWEMVAKSGLRATHLKPDRLPSELLKYVKMKSEMKFGNTISWKRFIEAWIQGEREVGHWKNYLTVTQSEYLDNIIEEKFPKGSIFKTERS